jgi:CRP-like cAMP-binding protein
MPVPSLARYAAKLDARTPLSPGARDRLLALPVRREEFSTHRHIVHEGERTTRSFYLESGFVSCSKGLRDGARQIVSFHVPGEMVDLQSALVTVSDHGIYTHAPSAVLSIAHADILDLVEDSPEIGRALWFDTLVDAAVFREWTLNIGRRSAVTGTAHLLLELFFRFKAAGLTNGNAFELPATQADLADALGLSAVHMNRSLQTLRGERLIRTFQRTVTIENMEAMVHLAEFDPSYMHPEGPREPLRGRPPRPRDPGAAVHRPASALA